MKHKKRATRRKNPTCKLYKTCDEVPCGEMMNKCEPSYCVPGLSKNWGPCNMSNWGPEYAHLQSTCKDERKCKMQSRRRKNKNQVLATTMHQKMPYIWRFLDVKTRKKMITLANKPLNEINIPVK